MEAKMGCGCRRNNNNVGRQHRIITPRTIRLSSPTNVNFASPTASSPLNMLSSSGMNAERRKTEKLRRDAIRKALGK